MWSQEDYSEENLGTTPVGQTVPEPAFTFEETTTDSTMADGTTVPPATSAPAPAPDPGLAAANNAGNTGAGATPATTGTGSGGGTQAPGTLPGSANNTSTAAPPKPIMASEVPCGDGKFSYRFNVKLLVIKDLGTNQAQWYPTSFFEQYESRQLRDTNILKEGKYESYKQLQPLATPFTRSDNLNRLQIHLLQEAKNCGVHYLLFLPDPSDPDTNINVVEYPHLVSRNYATIVTYIEQMQTLYDLWDQQNLKKLKDCLRLSLDEELREAVLDVHQQDDHPLITFLKVVRHAKMMTSTEVEALENSIKKFDPRKVPNVDINVVVRMLKTSIKALKDVGQYHPRLLLKFLPELLTNMVEEKYEMSWKGPIQKIIEVYQHYVLNHQFNVKVTGMDLERQLAQHLDAHGSLDPMDSTSVLDKIKDLYLQLKAEGQWLASAPVDKQTPPSNFGANAAPTGDTLTSTMGGGVPPAETRTCFDCGKPGHLAGSNLCPNPKPKHNKKKNKGNGNNNNNNKSKGKSKFKGDTNWKKIPPKSGQPEKKTVEGVEYFWCAKCNEGKGRWTLSHGTQEHGRKPEAPTANAGLCFDPAAWHASISWCPPPTPASTCATSQSPMWSLLMSLLPFMMLFAVLSVSPDAFQSTWTCVEHGATWLLSAATDWWITAAPVLSGTAWSVASAVSAYAHAIGQFVFTYNVTLTAPVLWFILLGLAILRQELFALFDGPPPEPSLPSWFEYLPGAWNRKQRRHAEQQARRMKRRRKFRKATIRDHKFHRSYPRHLREQGLFYHRAPTLTEQVELKAAVALHWMFQHGIYLANRVIGREGGRKRDVSYSNCRPADCYRPCSRRARRRAHRQSQRKRASANHEENIMARQMHRGSPSAHRLDLLPTQQDLNNAHAMAQQVNACCYHSPQVPVELHQALLSPARLREAMPPSATFSVIWDSGASCSISPDKADFVGPIRSTGMHARLDGLAKGLGIKGIGEVEWSFVDVSGGLRTLRIPCLYVPDSPLRLMATTSVAQHYPDEVITLDSQKATLSGVLDDPQRRSIMAYVNPQNNIPTSTAYRPKEAQKAAVTCQSSVSTVHESNLNLSEAEKELLKWHQRLGHLSFKKIQFLMRTGILAYTANKRRLHTAAAKIDHAPKCAACQFGKQTIRPTSTTTTTQVKDKVDALRRDQLHPGDKVCVDHFVCSTKGRSPESRGGANSNNLCGGCIFVDCASGKIHVEFQVHLNTHETLRAKESYEMSCRDEGVIVKEYLTDSGSAFTSKGFAEHLSQYRQTTSFAGTGAHHQNAIAERAIRTIMSIARTMMLHAAIHWPEMSDATLWPLAVQYAVFLYNHVPDHTTGLSPTDLFTRTRWPQRKLQDLHVFGCPVYVLDKKIADGNKLPRWKPRSKRCMYVGVSDKHASSVPLVMNPLTRTTTTPWNVVFDDWFATVASVEGELPDFGSDEWQKLFGDSCYQFMDADDETMDDQLEGAPPSLVPRERVADAMDQARGHSSAPVSVPDSAPVAPPAPASPQRETSSWREPTVASPVSQRERNEGPSSATDTAHPSTAAETVHREEPLTSTPAQQQTASEPAPPTPRATAPPAQLAPVTPKPPRMLKEIGDHNKAPAGQEPLPAKRRRRPVTTNAFHNISDHSCMQRRLLQSVPFAHLYVLYGIPVPLVAVYKASNSDPDTLNYEQAMADTDNIVEWKKAAQKEISSLESMDCWDVVPVTDATEPIVPTHWVFKLKRYPDGSINKFKGRLVVRGDLMSEDYETYAPVAQWSTIRMFLILSLTWNWETLSIDFSNAFVHAKLDKPLWIHLPRGFRPSANQSRVKSCLRLKRSLYGTVFAPRLWSDNLFEALRKVGLTQSKHDPCLWMKPGMMLVLWVDDVGVAVRQPKDAEKLVQDLKDLGFDLTAEGSFTSFLGIKFERDEANGTFTMTQPGLIDKIIEATGMKDCNPNKTPAAPGTTLGKDPDGEPMSEDWNYASVVGMLLYLSTNSRMDIMFAVSQVCRFTHSPKQSHATAVKTLVRYLAGTRDKGTIFKPSGTLELEAYADSDFAGLYGSDPDRDPSSAKSRMAYLICLGACPLLGKSCLISKICLSTTEAEYAALSACLRELLCIKRVLEEIVQVLDVPESLKTTIKATVFEDNAACLSLATEQRLTNRTRYYHTSWHWFWEHVGDKDSDKEIKAEKIETSLQNIDYGTKALPVQPFEANRFRVQGW